MPNLSSPDRPAEAPELILASGSRYRAELLARLRLPFTALPSQADETPQAGESPRDLVLRLSAAKARALRRRHPQAWILGSDQVAVVDGRIVGKPGGREQAVAQLRSASGRAVEFLTGVVLLTPGGRHEAVDVTRVRFRSLDAAAIGRYVDAEPAYDCAGSFKCEGFGISLFDAIETTDPTALIGLPLIAVCRLLREAGYELL